MKQVPVRYGRNYKVVLAIVLPALLIAPFIWAMQLLKPLEEWVVLLIIFAFLGGIIGFSLWLVFRIYPGAMLSINGSEINLRFDPGNFLSPTDFSFTVKNISSFTQGEIGGDEYYIFELRDPARKFQISASSYSVEDRLAFNDAMAEISERINQVKT